METRPRHGSFDQGDMGHPDDIALAIGLVCLILQYRRDVSYTFRSPERLAFAASLARGFRLIWIQPIVIVAVPRPGHPRAAALTAIGHNVGASGHSCPGQYAVG